MTLCRGAARCERRRRTSYAPLCRCRTPVSDVDAGPTGSQPARPAGRPVGLGARRNHQSFFRTNRKETSRLQATRAAVGDDGRTALGSFRATAAPASGNRREKQDGMLCVLRSASGILTPGATRARSSGGKTTRAFRGRRQPARPRPAMTRDSDDLLRRLCNLRRPTIVHVRGSVHITYLISPHLASADLSHPN